MSDYYLTVSEVAERYDVTVFAVYHWIKNGLPFKKKRVIGKGTIKVINVNDLEKFLNLGIIEDEETDHDE